MCTIEKNYEGFYGSKNQRCYFVYKKGGYMIREDPREFTDSFYGELLDHARAQFRFVLLGDDLSEDGICVWRHDIDMSPHRAYRLAQIEAERGLRTNYFVMFGSRFYNPFEPASTQILRRISDLGHPVGLHFDISAQRANNAVDLELALAKEADMLSSLIGVPVQNFTLHDPTKAIDLSLDKPVHQGLVNGSASSVVSSFTYCSDSNGLWRHRRLQDVISDSTVTRLYALTHAEWWTPEVMTPQQRVQRCIDGRAASVRKHYSLDLAAQGRPIS